MRTASAALIALALLAGCAQQPSRGGGRHETLTCSSEGYALQRCASDWRDGRLLETYSRERCERGDSWDVDRRGLWVTRGCRGRFERLDDRDDRDDDDRTRTLSCASEGNAYRRCPVDGRVTRVRLRQRLSVADCDYRESWGWNRDSVWVDKGCRAEFEVTTR